MLFEGKQLDKGILNNGFRCIWAFVAIDNFNIPLELGLLGYAYNRIINTMSLCVEKMFNMCV